MATEVLEAKKAPSRWFDLPFASNLLDWPRLDRFFEAAWPEGMSERWMAPMVAFRVEEERNGDGMLIRCELPGLDPDNDVEITVEGDLLTVSAERKQQEKKEEEGGGRTGTEFRYGSVRRSWRLPQEVKVDDITATYRDGILELHVPAPVTEKVHATKVAVTRR